MSGTAEPTVFERISAGEIPARMVVETDRVIAFHDIAPQAPVHVIVTPREGRHRDVVELAAADPELLAELVSVAKRIADDLTDGEFRLIFNTGPSAGQTVFHVHAHLLGGGLREGSLAG